MLFLEKGKDLFPNSRTFLFLFAIALVHAILPFLFIRTASDIVCEMSKDMECRKGK